MGLEPPRRIHRVTRLLELSLNEDVRAQRPPLAALAVSRVRGGLPAPGFFDRLKRLGVDLSAGPAAVHAAILDQLFDERANH